MKSFEGFAPPQTKKDEIEREIAPQSPEVEVVEVGNEQLEQHAEVQAEAGQFANETKSVISSVVEKPQPENIAEVKEQTPEELREERRMGIIKEFEKEWETTNGPMKRLMTKADIAGTRSWEVLYGRKWDGGTTRMTDAAIEFFFDPKGMGKSSVPVRAEKTLAERFPEYAKKAEQPVEDKPKTAEKIIANEIPKPRQETEKPKEVSAHKLSEVFEKAGVESRVVKIENGGEFSEIIILDKKEIPTEKMARLYRGINHLDASVLEQIPYAMRTENGSGKPTILESVRQEVDTLAKNPTYENLLAYTDKVRSNLSPEEVRRMDDDLARIENGILDGNSTRKELIYKQIEHGGGWGDSGITSYISASFSPYEAAGYGNEGLVVIDVPLSEIEDFRADGTEVNIKGALDKKYITAILPRKREGTKEKEQLNQEIYRALEKVYASITVPLFDNKEMLSQREQKLLQEAELDKEQWKKDVELVRQKRVAKLAKKFPEVKIDSGSSEQNSLEQGVDSYTKVKQDIFDQYKTRLEKIGRNGRNIDDYEFSETEYSERKKFDREKTSDIMLIKLRELTLGLEEREEERNRR